MAEQGYWQVFIGVMVEGPDPGPNYALLAETMRDVIQDEMPEIVQVLGNEYKVHAIGIVLDSDR